MASFRAGQLFNVASSGIGDVLNIKMAEEQKRIDREWQLTLSDLAEERANTRQAASFEHAETMAATRETGETERASTSAKATAEFRTSTMTAEENRFQQGRVDDARQQLQKTLLELNEGMAKELEMAMPHSREKIVTRYTDLKNQAITGTVAWLASQHLPGYEVKDERGLQSLLIQSGMDVAGAGNHAKQIWGSITGGDDLIAGDQKPNMDEIYADGGRDAGGLTRADRENRIAGYQSPAVSQAGAAAPPPNGAPAITSPQLPNPKELYQPGSMGSIFNSEPLMNPDGTPKFPANKDAGLYKLGRFLNTPVPYGQ